MSVAVSSKSNNETKARASKSRTPKKNGISEQEVRILAYSLYQRRCADGLEGDETSDWIEAERQLLTP